MKKYIVVTIATIIAMVLFSLFDSGVLGGETANKSCKLNGDQIFSVINDKTNRVDFGSGLLKVAVLEEFDCAHGYTLNYKGNYYIIFVESALTEDLVLHESSHLNHYFLRGIFPEYTGHMDTRDNERYAGSLPRVYNTVMNQLQEQGYLNE